VLMQHQTIVKLTRDDAERGPTARKPKPLRGGGGGGGGGSEALTGIGDR